MFQSICHCNSRYRLSPRPERDGRAPEIEGVHWGYTLPSCPLPPKPGFGVRVRESLSGGPRAGLTLELEMQPTGCLRDSAGRSTRGGGMVG